MRQNVASNFLIQNITDLSNNHSRFSGKIVESEKVFLAKFVIFLMTI